MKRQTLLLLTIFCIGIAVLCFLLIKVNGQSTDGSTGGIQDLQDVLSRGSTADISNPVAITCTTFRINSGQAVSNIATSAASTNCDELATMCLVSQLVAAAGADNLGNHTMTQDLETRGYSIKDGNGAFWEMFGVRTIAQTTNVVNGSMNIQNRQPGQDIIILSGTNWIRLGNYLNPNLLTLQYPSLTALRFQTFQDDSGILALLTNETGTGSFYWDASLTNSTPSHLEGRLFYDTNHHTLAFYNDDTDVTVDLGDELVTRVRNTSGTTMTNGQLVRIVGQTGHDPDVNLAIANGGSNEVIGMVTSSTITNNQHGYITKAGAVHDLDTSGTTIGDIVYLSDSVTGGWTVTKPTIDGTNNIVRVGYIQVVHANQGIIGIKIEQCQWGNIGGNLTNQTDLAAYILALVPGFFDSSGDLFIDGNVTNSIAETNYTQIVGWSTNGLDLMVATSSNMTLQADGDYDVHCYLSFSDGNSETLRGSIFTNGVEFQKGGKFVRKLGVGGDVGSASLGAILYNMSSNDVIDIRLENLDSTSDAVFQAGNFTIHRL